MYLLKIKPKNVSFFRRWRQFPGEIGNFPAPHLKISSLPCVGDKKYDMTITKKGGNMKISVDKNVVEFVPESDQETVQLERLWNTVVDCVKFNKKLVPVGEFVPQKSNLARFAIEG